MQDKAAITLFINMYFGMKLLRNSTFIFRRPGKYFPIYLTDIFLKYIPGIKIEKQEEVQLKLP